MAKYTLAERARAQVLLFTHSRLLTERGPIALANAALGRHGGTFVMLTGGAQ